MIALVYLVWLGFLVCDILVLIKLFKKEGVGLGILGILCFIYAFIWGWINHKAQKITNIMLIWTALIIIGFILNIVIGARFIPTQ